MEDKSKATGQKFDTKSTVILAISCLAFVGVFVLAIILSQQPHIEEHPTRRNPQPTVQEHEYTQGYRYKIRYDFGSESYIYLMNDEDQTIKVETVIPIYDIIPDCDCMKSTGAYKHETKRIDISGDAKYKAIEVFKELATKAGSTTFDADEMNLTSYQQLVLLAVTLDNAEYITLKTDVKIMTQKIDHYTRDAIYSVSNNSIAQKASLFVAQKYDGLVAQNKDNPNVVAFKIELAYVGPHSFSFVFYMIDQNGVVSGTQGYTFDLNGDPREFDMGGRKDPYHRGALVAFESTEYYEKYGAELDKNWESILRETMFETSHWYKIENGVMFVLPAKTLGITSLGNADIKIKIDSEDDF